MTSMIQQSGGGYAETIAKPLLQSQQEKDQYNTVFRAAISRIEEAVASNPALQDESKGWIKRLQNRVEVNNRLAREAANSPFPLLYYVKRGDEKGLKFLLRAGEEDPNQQDRSGCTALHWAAKLGEKSMVELLLQCPKIDKTICTKRGNTALQLAEDREIQDLLEN